MTPFPARHKRTTAPVDPPDPPRPADPVAARVQARVDAIEAQPLDTAPRHRGNTPTQGSSPTAKTSAEGQPGLDQQLDALREQLNAALVDIDARLTAADERAAAAEALATSLAEVASARTANLLHAVDQLANDLRQIAASDPRMGHLRGAVDRLRARLQ